MCFHRHGIPMPNRTASPSAKKPSASATPWFVQHPGAARRLPAPTAVATVLSVVANGAVSTQRPLPVQRLTTAAVDSVSDDDAWGSDFDDDIYTEEELAAFNAKFDQDTWDIERFNIENNVPNFNRPRVAPPPPPRRSVGSVTTVSNAPGGGHRT